MRKLFAKSSQGRIEILFFGNNQKFRIRNLWKIGYILFPKNARCHLPLGGKYFFFEFLKNGISEFKMKYFEKWNSEFFIIPKILIVLKKNKSSILAPKGNISSWIRKFHFQNYEKFGNSIIMQKYVKKKTGCFLQKSTFGKIFFFFAEIICKIITR